MWPWSEIKKLTEESDRYKRYYESECAKHRRLIESVGGRSVIDELEFLRKTVKDFAVVEYVQEQWQAYYKVTRTLPESEQELKELRLYTRVLEGKLTSEQIVNAHQECRALKDLIKT